VNARREPPRDPARTTWRDRWNRDSARCRREAARARELEATFRAAAEEIAAGRLLLGRCAGENLVRRLEHDATVMACVANWDDEVARLLEQREESGSVLDADAADRALIRHAGIHYVADVGDAAS
jgi:hypothetical protein